jgi:hypothetical protein
VKNGKADIWQLLHDTRAGDSDNPHLIFQKISEETDTNRWLSNCHFEAVSEWAFDLLLDEYKDRKADVIAEFYYMILGWSDAAALRGHLLERQILSHLKNIRERTFPIRRLTDSEDSEEMTWTYRGPNTHTFKEWTSFIDEITKAVGKRSPVHLVPSIPNFAAVDSILYDPNDPKAVLTCIQITMKESHPINVNGLKRIQGWLKPGGALAGLRPTRAKWWCLIFVVPSTMASAYKSQYLDGDTDRGEWAGKVHQYVLGLKEEPIFGRSGRSATTTLQEGEQQVRYEFV